MPRSPSVSRARTAARPRPAHAATPPAPSPAASWRVDAATPSWSSPRTTKLSERRFGNRYRSTMSVAVSGSSSCSRSTVSSASSHAQPTSAAGVHTEVGVATLVPRPRPDERAERDLDGRSSTRSSSRSDRVGPIDAGDVAGAEDVGGSDRVDLGRGAVDVDVLRHEVGGNGGGAVHAERRCGARAATEAVHAGDPGEHGVHHRVGERSADLAFVGILDRDPPHGRGLLLRCRIGLVGVDHLVLDEREVVGAVRARVPERRLGERRLLVDVEPGERDGERVAVATEFVHRDLQRRTVAPHPSCRTPGPGHVRAARPRSCRIGR